MHSIFHYINIVQYQGKVMHKLGKENKKSSAEENIL